MGTRKLIDYDAMAEAATYYTNKAQELREMIEAIKSRNAALVGYDWQSETAEAFQERFETDHATKMEVVAEALDDISRFISDYISGETEGDHSQASAIR